MTNLEIAKEEAQSREYCGNASHLPKARTTLPCFKAKIQGRLGLALLDTGATTNFVDRAFLENQSGNGRKADSTTICLADRTAQEQCSAHHSLIVELGSSATTVKAVKMKLLHFDAILGIPWLCKARPMFEWDEDAIAINGEMIWPLHRVPQEKLPDGLAQIGDTETREEEDANESEDEDVTPLGTITPEQREEDHDHTVRLKHCLQQ